MLLIYCRILHCPVSTAQQSLFQNLRQFRCESSAHVQHTQLPGPTHSAAVRIVLETVTYLQDEPQSPALPDIVQVDRMLSVKPSKAHSQQRETKPNPTPLAVNTPDDLTAAPPAYSELISGDATPPVLASAYGSDDSLASPHARAPTVFIHVDDEPTRFPYHEPPALPKPTPPRNVPKSNSSGRRSSTQTTSSGKHAYIQHSSSLRLFVHCICACYAVAMFGGVRHIGGRALSFRFQEVRWRHMFCVHNANSFQPGYTPTQPNLVNVLVKWGAHHMCTPLPIRAL